MKSFVHQVLANPPIPSHPTWCGLLQPNASGTECIRTHGRRPVGTKIPEIHRDQTLTGHELTSCLLNENKYTSTDLMSTVTN